MSLPTRQIAGQLRRAWYRFLFFADLPSLIRILRYRKIRAAYYQNFWNQIAKNLKANIVHNDHGFTRISRDGSTTFVNQSLLMLEDHLTLKIMGDKSLTYSLLDQAGYPTARYLKFTIGDVGRAVDFLKRENSVVVKPVSGTGGGRGVTTGIKSASELILAARKASRFDSNLLVEEQLQGGSYRLLFFMGKFIDAIRRDPPVVVGDGQSSLRQLIARENKLRENQPSTRALSPLVIDADARNWMKDNAMRLSDVPASGKTVQVKRAVNENDSSGNWNVTAQVNAQIIEKCAELVQRLGVEFAGVDLICDDISGPFHPDNCRIGEINTTPGLHHHYLIANPDEGNLVAETVLEHMLTRGIGTMTIGESNGKPNGVGFRSAAEIKRFPGTFGPGAKGSAATDSVGY